MIAKNAHTITRKLTLWATEAAVPMVWAGTSIHAAILGYRRYRMRRLAGERTFVFVFLGEFGYELLGWQGWVRRLARKLPPGSKLVCGVRPGMELLYERAALTVDVTQDPMYLRSVASGYWALHPVHSSHHFCLTNRRYDALLKQRLRALIEPYLHGFPPAVFVFSSDAVQFGSIPFGAPWGCPMTFWRAACPVPGIYEAMNPDLQEFRRIGPDPSDVMKFRTILGPLMDRGYVFVQGRVPRLQRLIPTEFLGIIERIARYAPVVFARFDTGRAKDTVADIPDLPGVHRLVIRSFRDQVALISAARTCVVFTEGDLGSPAYVPPLAGKDVHVVAPAWVFSLPSAPVEYWNSTLFRFGGKMIPVPWESFRGGSRTLDEFARSVAG
jgi:hypothetical protein